MPHLDHIRLVRLIPHWQDAAKGLQNRQDPLHLLWGPSRHDQQLGSGCRIGPECIKHVAFIWPPLQCRWAYSQMDALVFN